MKKYIVLRNKSLSNLEYHVSTFLNTGWKLVGGVSQNNSGEYIQAMAC